MEELEELGYSQEQVEEANEMHKMFLEIKDNTEMLKKVTEATFMALGLNYSVENIDKMSQQEFEQAGAAIDTFYYVLVILIHEGFVCLKEE